MLGSTVLDVVIGLLFVFFVFSLLVSGINEGVRKLLNTRSKVLWGSIERLLHEPKPQDPEEDEEVPSPGPIRRWLDEPTAGDRVNLSPRLPSAPPWKKILGLAPAGARGVAGVAPDGASLFEQLFDHPLIAKLDPAAKGTSTRISHVPPREFARALVDILAARDGDGTPEWKNVEAGVARLPQPLRSQFLVLLAEARGDIAEFRQAVEGWFDSSMNRVSEWYKKRTRKAMAVYGLIVAGLFNVSAVVITTDLYEDEIVRDAVVSLADSQVTDAANIEAQINDLVETRLPVLWRQCETGDGETRLCGFESTDRWAATLIGWIVTAAALSMGASFWFSLLTKAFKVRDATRT